MSKTCLACKEQYNKSNKKYCSRKCFEKSPRIITKYKQFDDSPISHIKINTKEKAYSLGFLWGDGSLFVKKCKKYNLYYPVLNILKTDYDNIEKILNSIGDWKKYISKPRISQPNYQTHSVLYDKSWGKFLFENDYKNKSIGPTKILSQIPDDLKHYWWRGLSDADGCFYANQKNRCFQYSIAGPIEQSWIDAEELFKSLSVRYKVTTRKTKTGSSSYIRVCGMKNLHKIGEYLYQGDKELCLSRKIDKYNSVPNL